MAISPSNRDTLMADLKDLYKRKRKSKDIDFNKLGDSDESTIDQDGFCKFLKEEMQYDGDTGQLFDLLDNNQKGVITLGDFMKSMEDEKAERQKKRKKSVNEDGPTDGKKSVKEDGPTDEDILDELALRVFRYYQGIKSEAFSKLAGKDGRIELSELQGFLTSPLEVDARNQELGAKEKMHLVLAPKHVKKIWRLLDSSGDGSLDKKEWNKLWGRYDGKTDQAILHTLSEFLRKKYPLDRKGIQKAFDKLGGADDKKISKAEFKQCVLEEMKYDGPVADIGIAFRLLDINGNDSIDMDEFMQLWAESDTDGEVIKKLITIIHQKWKTKEKAWQVAANAASGNPNAEKISEKDFVLFLKDQVGYKGLLSRVFHLVDTDKSGSIRKNEFLAMWLQDKTEDEILRDVYVIFKENYKTCQGAFEAVAVGANVTKKSFTKRLGELYEGKDGDLDRAFKKLDTGGVNSLDFTQFQAFWVEVGGAMAA